MHLIFLLLAILISGCTFNKQSTSLADQEAKEQMARQVLQESSPRNMNEHPKVVDEFKKSINLGIGGKPIKHDNAKQKQETSIYKKKDQ